MKLSEEFLKGIWKENPVLVLILGMCPSLATSSNAVNGMGGNNPFKVYGTGGDYVVNITGKLK